MAETVAYVRVSSRAQDTATQRAAIQRAATARGLTIDRWIVEHRSARVLDRPGLAELREGARTGQIATCIVYRIDRLTRSGIRDTLALLEEFRRAGCRVLNIADGWELGEPGYAGDVVVAVLAWAAQMERLAIGERIAAARERVERSGGAWGRPRTVSARKAEIARKMRSQGKSLRAIARELEVPYTCLRRSLL